MIQTGHISSSEQSFNSADGGERNSQFEEAAHPEPGFQSPSTPPVEKNVDCISECVNSDTSFSSRTLYTFIYENESAYSLFIPGKVSGQSQFPCGELISTEISDLDSNELP